MYEHELAGSSVLDEDARNPLERAIVASFNRVLTQRHVAHSSSSAQTDPESGPL